MQNTDVRFFRIIYDNLWGILIVNLNEKWSFRVIISIKDSITIKLFTPNNYFSFKLIILLLISYCFYFSWFSDFIFFLLWYFFPFSLFFIGVFLPRSIFPKARPILQVWCILWFIHLCCIIIDILTFLHIKSITIFLSRQISRTFHLTQIQLNLFSNFVLTDK